MKEEIFKALGWIVQTVFIVGCVCLFAKVLPLVFLVSLIVFGGALLS